MSMQNRIYKAGAKWDQFYNDTVVDYSLQVDAYWQQLRAKMPRLLGHEVASNVIYVDFPTPEATAEIIPSLETVKKN